MQLSARQREGLVQLITSGHARAATALADFTGLRISVEEPSVGVLPLAEAGAQLQGPIGPTVATVRQRFSGPLTGEAMFRVDEQSAVTLIGLLGDKNDTGGAQDAQEVLIEIGSIIVNACVGAFGNVLQVQVAFAVPELQIQPLATSLAPIPEGISQPVQALVAQTRLRLEESNIGGYMTIVLGFSSLARLLAALDRWQRG